MTTAHKVIKNKLGLLKLAQQLSNVTQACEVMGYSRDRFYRLTQFCEVTPFREYYVIYKPKNNTAISNK